MGGLGPLGGRGGHDVAGGAADWAVARMADGGAGHAPATGPIGQEGAGCEGEASSEGAPAGERGERGGSGGRWANVWLLASRTTRWSAGVPVGAGQMGR